MAQSDGIAADTSASGQSGPINIALVSVLTPVAAFGWYSLPHQKPSRGERQGDSLKGF